MPPDTNHYRVVKALYELACQYFDDELDIETERVCNMMLSDPRLPLPYHVCFNTL